MLKHQVNRLVLAVDFVMGMVFIEPNEELCIGRCYAPMSESPDFANAVAMAVAMICIVWIAVLSMTD
ncbi:hypothetical protein BC456_05465 [Neisseria meningitidis]|nr:hypothetical protein BC456_05465 [Neisseria meningitidis]